MPFSYPPTIHVRQHGPAGYLDYRSYKPWLRDEFSFRCVYCLMRETYYPNGQDSFAVEHAQPQHSAPDPMLRAGRMRISRRLRAFGMHAARVDGDALRGARIRVGPGSPIEAVVPPRAWISVDGPEQRRGRGHGELDCAAAAPGRAVFRFPAQPPVGQGIVLSFDGGAATLEVGGQRDAC